MTAGEIKILNNVFISSGDNYVTLCSMRFNDKFEKIIPLHTVKIDWSDISDPIKKDKILKAFSVKSVNAIDGKGLFLMPAGIDTTVTFFSDPILNSDSVSDISFMAANGGSTILADLPVDACPVSNKKSFEEKLQLFSGKCYSDFLFWGYISADKINNKIKIERTISELMDSGVIGFTFFMNADNRNSSELTDENIQYLLSLIKDLNKPFAFHAEDNSLVSKRKIDFLQNNKTEWHHYCVAHDIEAECNSVERIINLNKNINCRIHFFHISSKMSLNRINKAAAEGMQVSAETCPHYLAFTQPDFHNSDFKDYFKTLPPVKFIYDKEALWRGVTDNSISFITSDHINIYPRNYSSENYWNLPVGIEGAGFRIPYLLSEGFLSSKLTLEQCIKLLSTNAATYFGIQNKGKLQPGYDADFCIIDLWNFESSKNSTGAFKTPFEKINFKVSVNQTWLRGEKISYNNPSGKLIKL